MKNNFGVVYSIMICFLVIGTPIMNASNYTREYDKNVTFAKAYYNEELIHSILTRLDEIRIQQLGIASLGINWTDPDGPLSGGLDDITDYINLVLGMCSVLCVPSALKNLFFAQDIYEFIRVTILTGILCLGSLEWFGEAFDVVENPIEDGR